MDQTDDNNEDVVETKTEVKASAKETTPAKVTDWEGAYKGLQRTLEKLQKRFEKLEADYDALQEEHEGHKANVRQGESALKSVQDQLASKDAEIKRLQGELDAKGKANARTMLIMAEFPELANFEGEGLLPDAEDDEKLREKLTKFRDTIGATVKQGVGDKLKGAGAKATTKVPPPEMDEDQIYDRMVLLAGSTDRDDQAEYQKLQRQWDALHDN